MSDNDKPQPGDTLYFDPQPGDYVGAFQSAFDHSTFPFTINVGSATVTLHGDGKWEGDIVAVKRAVAEMKGCQGTGAVLMWLVLRQLIRDDERFW